jgi:hypothetical protein
MKKNNIFLLKVKKMTFNVLKNTFASIFLKKKEINRLRKWIKD